MPPAQGTKDPADTTDGLMPLGDHFDSVLDAARMGADWAVAALYRDLQPRLLRYLRAQEPAEHEDLCSETWLDVARGLNGFVGEEGDLRRWVFSIAHRRLVDHRRRAGRRPVRNLIHEEVDALLSGGDVEDEAMADIATRQALAMIAALPVAQAEIVLLRVVAGLGAEEVGTIMGMRAGAVRVAQHRALARLAQDLALERVAI